MAESDVIVSIPTEWNDRTDKTVDTHSESDKKTVPSVHVSQAKLNDVIDGSTVEDVPKVQIEVTRPEIQITSSEEMPDSVNEQDVDTRQQSISDGDFKQPVNSDETEIGEVLNDTSATKETVSSEEIIGEESASQDEENDKLTKEDSNEDAQDGANNSCHSNSFKKDDEQRSRWQSGWFPWKQQ